MVSHISSHETPKSFFMSRCNNTKQDELQTWLSPTKNNRGHIVKQFTFVIQNQSTKLENKTSGIYLKAKWGCRWVITVNNFPILVNQELGKVPLDIISKNSPFA